MTFPKSFAGKKILGASGLMVILIGLLFYLFNYASTFTRQGDYGLADSTCQQEKISEPPTLLFGMIVNDQAVKEDVVKRNQVFADLLGGYSIAPAVVRELATLPRKVFDFRKIAAGRKYTVIWEDNCSKSVSALVYESNPIDYVIFHLKDSLSIENCQHAVAIQERSVTGEIQSSLSETIEELGISHELTNKFVDIFGWQVDFQRLQKGDQFKLMYEEVKVEGKPIGTGNILAIYFEHFGVHYYAFPFDQGDGPDYFDEEGQSLRKALLKYPIEFTRISSRYNLNRFHPIAKVFRPHLGTDFAAAAGTPIRTVGDGMVEEAQYNGGNGNYVKVRHNGTYSTAYLHMSKIAEGIVPGAHVKQGQTIGFVGSTGWATGPHVCYRFWKNGVQVDALNVKLPASLPVRKENFEKFREVRDGLVRRLDCISFPASIHLGVVAAN